MVEIKARNSNESTSPFLECVICKKQFTIDRTDYFCPNCVNEHLGYYGNMQVSYNYRALNRVPFPIEPFAIFEGNTPLIQGRGLSEHYGFSNVYYKCEMVNPTGSFKDRGSAFIIAQALKLGMKNIIAASSGNLATSLAAYSLKAGLNLHIFVPKNTSPEKLELIRLLKANVVYVDGKFEDAYYASLKSMNAEGFYSAHAGSNPFALEGYKNISLEIFNKIGVPDYVIVPAGDGALLSAIWKGFMELRAVGLAERTPRMIAVQVKGADPIVTAYHRNLLKYVEKNPVDSIAEGIVASESYNSILAVKALRESGGFPVSVTDEEIKRNLGYAVREGLIIEPTSAASLAALEKLKEDGRVGREETIVPMLTGSGIKTLSEISKVLNVD
jgi:threonine synthase